MTLSVALSILACPELVKQHLEYAQELLDYFVCNSRQLYGPQFLVYNVHSMLHIASDVRVHGSMDQISAFPFENYMQHLKKMVRSGKRPLSQIVRRIHEMENNCLLKSKSKPKPHITAKQPNNAFVLADSSCCEVVREDSDSETVLCRVYAPSKPLFHQPM